MNFKSLASSLSSLTSTVQDSSVTSAVATFAQAGYSMATNEKEECQICHSSVSKGQSLLGITTFERCTLCHKKCCGKCITKFKDLIPDRVKEALGKDRLDWVCVNCDPIVVQMFMKVFHKMFCEKLDKNIHEYMQANESLIYLHNQPGPTEDTMSRRIYRFAQVAEVVVSYAGLSSLQYAFKAAKFVYMGKELSSLLISGDFLEVLTPVVSAMGNVVRKELGTKSILSLYYLACFHKLALKIRPESYYSRTFAIEDIEIENPSEMDYHEICPTEMLDFVGEYCDSALWLYACKLPHPHSSNEWSGWYLSQLIRRQEWTLLACVDDTTKLANRYKCPAFAVVIRNISSNNSTQGSNDVLEENKEVLLIVRGSHSVN
jgi:hypothetical protein